MRRLYAAFHAWRNRTSIRTQLCLVIGTVVIALFVLLLTYSYVTQYNANARHEKDSISHILEVENEQLSAYVGELASFSLQLRNDASFMQIIAASGPVSYADELLIESSFRTQFYSRHDLRFMELSVYRGELCYRMEQPTYTLRSKAYVPPDTREDYAEFSARPAYLSFRPSDEGFLQVTRMIIDSPHTTPLAVVRFLADDSHLRRIISRHTQRSETVYVLGDDGAAYTSGGGEADVSAAIADGRDRVALGGETCLLVTSGLNEYGLRIAVTKPMNVINATLYKMMAVSVMIGVMAVLLMCLALFYLIHRLTLPLASLTRRMQRVGDGDFSSPANLQGSLEMKGLSEEANHMIANISALIDRTYVSSLNERTAQLAALQAQTNPHFLLIRFRRSPPRRYWRATTRFTG